MKNSFFLMLLGSFLCFVSCQSDKGAATGTAAQQNGDNKFDVSGANPQSPLKQPQNQEAVDKGLKSIKRNNSGMPLKVQERRSNLQLKEQKGLLQQRKSLNRPDKMQKVGFQKPATTQTAQ